MNGAIAQLVTLGSSGDMRRWEQMRAAGLRVDRCEQHDLGADDGGEVEIRKSGPRSRRQRVGAPLRIGSRVPI